ncbi:MAG: type II toxin-antitoxin system HicA family toxin [Spirosomataceae bacterium]
MNQSPKHFIKILEQNGWILKRIAGSHHILIHPERQRPLVVPVHGNRDIPTSLFRSLIKQAKLETKDFE